MKLICNICKYPIATISEDVKMPMQGSMFSSVDPKRMSHGPWNPVASFEYLYCPMCNKRPYTINPDNPKGAIMLNTDEGNIIVNNEGYHREDDFETVIGEDADAAGQDRSGHEPWPISGSTGDGPKELSPENNEPSPEGEEGETGEGEGQKEEVSNEDAGTASPEADDAPSTFTARCVISAHIP